MLLYEEQKRQKKQKKTVAALLKMQFCLTINYHTHKEQLLYVLMRVEVSLEKQEANEQ